MNSFNSPSGFTRFFGDIPPRHSASNTPSRNSDATSTPTAGNTTSQVSKVVKKNNTLNFTKPQAFVIIIVGPLKQTFTIHKSLISHYSAFFERAFSNKEFTEGQTQQMTIEDIEESDFGLLHHWLYFQSLDEPDIQDVPSLQLAKVWDLAERFLMPRLQNYMMDKLHLRIGLFGNQDLLIFEKLVEHAYESVKPREDNHLRKILVETFAFGSKKEWAAEVDDFPAEFWKDVTEVLLLFHDRQPPKFRGKMSSAFEHHVEVEDDVGSQKTPASKWVV